jgi:hypothetical protein
VSASSWTLNGENKFQKRNKPCGVTRTNSSGARKFNDKPALPCIYGAAMYTNGSSVPLSPLGTKSVQAKHHESKGSDFYMSACAKVLSTKVFAHTRSQQHQRRPSAAQARVTQLSET